MPYKTVSLSRHGRTRPTAFLQNPQSAGFPNCVFALTLVAAIICFASQRDSNVPSIAVGQVKPASALIVAGALMLLHRYWHGVPFRIKLELKRRRFLKTAIDTSTRGAILVFVGAHLHAYSRPIEELLTWVDPFMAPLCWFVYTCFRVLFGAVYLSLRRPDRETAVAFWLGLAFLIVFMEWPIVDHPLDEFP